MIIMLLKNIISALFISCLTICFVSCSKNTSGTTPPPEPPDTTHVPPVSQKSDVDFWLTKSDQSVLLQKQSTALVFGKTGNGYPYIDIDTNFNESKALA